LDGHFNPVVFWYQWDYLCSPAKNLLFVAGYLAEKGHVFRSHCSRIFFVTPRKTQDMMPPEYGWRSPWHGEDSKVIRMPLGSL
jgi:hypothetical protein